MVLQRRISKKISFVLGLSLLGLTAVSLLLANAITAYNWRRSFDPAAHGIPDMIAGYKVNAVLSPENSACMRPGTKRLLLQALAPDIEGFLENTGIQAIRQELVNLGVTEGIEWQINISGPGATREVIEAQNELWNARRGNGHCKTRGPAIIAGTPTP